MKNQTAQPKENTKNKGCGFSLILLFILGFIILIGYFTAEDPQTATETPEIQNTIQEPQIEAEKPKKKTWQTTSLSWTDYTSKIYANTPTETFKINNQWKIKWYVTPKDKSILEGGSATFSIKVYQPGGVEAYDVPIIWPIDTDRGTGVTASYPPGTYLLKINAISIRWVIEIEELK
ncbi:hypothetical protein KKA24_01700 [Patescibacteria group bacterium]|nr:hypothetical protein [Patescibacteria group bacterium]